MKIRIIFKALVAFSITVSLLLIPALASSSSGSFHTAVWTNAGDFEYNASTVGYGSASIEAYATTRRMVEISGMNPGDDASVTLASIPSNSIAAGAYHSLGLKSDGTVAAAGSNANGQTNVSSWTNIMSVAAGNRHSIGLKRDGTVAGAGYNAYGQLNVSSWNGIVAVATGEHHTVGLKGDGTVVATGLNNYRQANVAGWTGITAVSAGQQHTVGLKKDGTVIAAGVDENWRPFSQADPNSLLNWQGIIGIDAGMIHTVGLKEDGTVVADGDNSWGQSRVSSWKDVVAVSAGYTHTVGLKKDGTAVATGLNNWGQSNVSSWSGIVAISAGYYNTLGLKADGTVVATGWNGYGQSDTSSWSNILLPGQTRYSSSGTISNLKFNSGESIAEWGALTWHGSTPAGTAIRFRTRGAANEESLASASWSEYYMTSGSQISTAASRWLEVEATLQSNDINSTPVLDEFSVSFDRPPVIEAASSAVYQYEGAAASNYGTWTDGDGDEVTITASLGSVTKSGSGSSGSWIWSYTPSDGPDNQTVVITALNGLVSNSTSFEITVNNAIPRVGPISYLPSSFLTPVLRLDPAKLISEVSMEASFTDPGTLDTHTAIWDWGDGTVSVGTVDEANGSGKVAGSHSYSHEGNYLVRVMVRDKDGGEGASTLDYSYTLLPSLGL